jgi:hypothetical protein
LHRKTSKGATFMKRLVMTMVLTSVLSISALAGDQTTGGDAPAPVPSGTPQMTSSPSEIPLVPGAVATDDAVRQAFEAALSALLSVLSFV